MMIEPASLSVGFGMVVKLEWQWRECVWAAVPPHYPHRRFKDMVVNGSYFIGSDKNVAEVHVGGFVWGS